MDRNFYEFSTNVLFIPKKRVDAILDKTALLLEKPYTSPRHLVELVGKIVSTKYILGDIVSLKSRYLYSVIEGRSSWDAKLNILNFPHAHEGVIF